MHLSTFAQASATSLTLMALAVTGSVNAAETGFDAERDSGIRLVGGFVPVYTISESSTPTGGSSSTTYRWKDDNTTTGAVGIQSIHKLGGPVGEFAVQPIIGFEALVQAGTIKPVEYEIDGATFANNNGESLSYTGFSPAFLIGLRLAEPASTRIGFLMELQAGLGATLLSAELKNDLGRDRSFGYGFDGMVRVVAGLQEANWIGAVSLGARRSRAWTSFDMGSYTSDLTMDGVGAELLVAVGYNY